MAKTRVFVSFDFDDDQALKTFIIGQAKHPDSPFEVTDGSLKEAQPPREWEAKARAAINRADVFIVMLGSTTRSAPGVRKEVKMANELGKRKFQIIGYPTARKIGPVRTAAELTDGNGTTLRSCSLNSDGVHGRGHPPRLGLMGAAGVRSRSRKTQVRRSRVNQCPVYGARPVCSRRPHSCRVPGGSPSRHRHGLTRAAPGPPTARRLAAGARGGRRHPAWSPGVRKHRSRPGPW